LYVEILLIGMLLLGLPPDAVAAHTERRPGPLSHGRARLEDDLTAPVNAVAEPHRHSTGFLDGHWPEGALA